MFHGSSFHGCVLPGVRCIFWPPYIAGKCMRSSVEEKAGSRCCWTFSAACGNGADEIGRGSKSLLHPQGDTEVMFTTKWSTSKRNFGVVVEHDVKVRMPDGTLLDGDIYRPAANEKFPVILGAHAYNKHLQSPPLRPVGFTPMRGYMESGDSTFYARRGYVHAVFNVRGSGSSEGFYQLMGPL